MHPLGIQDNDQNEMLCVLGKLGLPALRYFQEECFMSLFNTGSGRSPGEGNGNPLQYSCLENPRDRGACRATVHGIAKSLRGFLELRRPWGFSPEAPRGSQGASRAAPGTSNCIFGLLVCFVIFSLALERDVLGERNCKVAAW